MVQRKKSESLTGMEPMTSRIPGGRSYVTGVLHNVRICTIEVIVSTERDEGVAISEMDITLVSRGSKCFYRAASVILYT